MNTDAHVATVNGRSLAVVDGSVSFDSTRAPFVQQRLTLPLTIDLEAIDPRTSPAPRVILESRKGAAVRTCDLHVRSYAVDRARGDVSLELASDEALLSDYAPAADDDTPYTHQRSLRAVCNYVLNKVIPGATLAATPNNEADVTVYSAATNLIPSPRVTDLSSYVAFNVTRSADASFPGPQDGVPHNGLHLYNATNIDSYVSVGGDTGDMRLGMTAGKTYTLSATGSVRATLGGATGPRALRIGVFYKVRGEAGYRESFSPALPTQVNASTRVAVTFTLPPDTIEAFVRMYHGRGSGTVTWALPRLSEQTEPGPHNTDYFWGGKPSNSAYIYTWNGNADASASERKVIIDAASADSLWWRAGVSALDFLAPIVQAAGFRLVCDERRRWTLRGEGFLAPGTLNLREGVNVIDGSDRVDRGDGGWFDARVTRYQWRDRNGNQQERIDAHVQPGYTRLTTVEVQAPYPGPGRSAYAVRRAQGRGREITATAPADWSVTADQSLAARLEGTPAQLGTVLAVGFDIASDRMTITARTVETPAGAINLLDGTVNALTGTVNNL